MQLDEPARRFQVYHSLPRPAKQAELRGRRRNDGDDEGGGGGGDDEGVVLSLKEYRRELLGKTMRTPAPEPLLVDIEAATGRGVDEIDSCAMADRADAKQRLDEIDRLIAVNTTQYAQAKKALSLTISKSERDDEEFVSVCF